MIPVLVVVVAATAQFAAVGWALWSAANAARAGARALHVGGDADRVAVDALPGPLRRHAEVEAGEDVSVRVRAPGLIPGVPPLGVTAVSRLDPLPDG